MPIPSAFKRFVPVSNQISRGAKVETPCPTFNSTFLIGYFVTKLPFDARPLIAKSAKSNIEF